jgi:hypothetical protein
MHNSFWQYGILNPRKHGTLLNLRAPDDPLAYEDDGPPIARSPGLDDRIVDYFAAMRDGDATGSAQAMNAVIDLTRADHAASGIPAYAHRPLPEDFVARIIEPILNLPTEHRSSAVRSVLEGVAPERRPLIRSQLDEGLRSALAAAGAATHLAGNDSAFDEDEEAEARSNQRASVADTEVHDLSEGGTGRVGYASSNPPAQSPQQKRIVKPYRRYAPPGGIGANDAELQEADAIAQDADVTIRKLTSRVLGNPQIEQSEDRFLREFARAVRRYYAEEGDRAVAAVAPRLKDQSYDTDDRYASYSSWDDRIYFTRLNRNQSGEEKVITVIHEVLHATLTMRNEAARVGYANAPKGSMIRAKHEAYVDNVAKTLAKMLGLNPKNYPPTNWKDYYRP